MRLQRFLQLCRYNLGIYNDNNDSNNSNNNIILDARCRDMPAMQLTACLLTTALSPPVLAKRLATKNVSKMTYIVSKGT